MCYKGGSFKMPKYPRTHFSKSCELQQCLIAICIKAIIKGCCKLIKPTPNLFYGFKVKTYISYLKLPRPVSLDGVAINGHHARLFSCERDIRTWQYFSGSLC